METKEYKKVKYKIPMSEFKEMLGITGRVRYLRLDSFNGENETYGFVEVEANKEVEK